jgi:uncharacterized RDD family membrane protein YckC
MSAVEEPAAQRAQRRAAARVGASRPPAADSLAVSDGYAGLVTRALAMSLDALVINATAVLVGVVVGLCLSVLHLPSGVDVAIAAVTGALWLIWTVGYFVFFWSSGGQTPGDRAMHIRVVDARGDGALKPRRALLRFVGLILAVIPLLAGILMMLWDDRRRCLQDRLARTVVVYVAEKPVQAAAGVPPAG